MSCLGPNYNPVPTREWYRFQNSCLIDSSVSADEVAVLKKGNVLQYKNNSAQITKMQRYSQIARGAWTNRTTTWASQTETYTNPNTKSLRRVNYIGTIGPNSIYDPRVCPGPFIPTSYSSLPSTGQGSTGPVAPIIPPPPPTPPTPPGPPGGLILPPLYPVTVEPDVVIPEGGSLQCNVVEDFCTGQIFNQFEQNFCNPTSSSDVPGPIKILCYNDSLPTYYPRTKLTYGTSGDKFPINAPLFPA